VNSKLRVANNQQISQAAAKAESGVHFSQAFIRQPGKRMAGYADRRTYFYKNKPVGKAVHLGVDVADVLNAPILAAAGGKVSHAGPLGIYGNTVILLHGLGVATLYAHLSDMGVSVGQTVAKGDRLGSSGATGLALGDHLHFSVLVGGMYTDPVEWWDPHWINDSFISRVSLAGLPWPGGGAAQARTETRPEGESRP
jgi:murein DD-endopeptidase MepM/ murein hydrolase activator NlpD